MPMMHRETDRFERLHMLCKAALAPAQAKANLSEENQAYEDLVEGLQYFDLAVINKCLWQLSTGRYGYVWRPFTHWFRRAYGDFVIAGRAF